MRSATASVSRRTAVKEILSTVTAAALGSPRSNVPIPQGPDYPRVGTYGVGLVVVDINRRSVRVWHSGDPSRSLWETTPDAPFLRVGAGRAVFREHGDPLGFFAITYAVSATHSFQRIDSVETVDARSVVAHGTLAGSPANVTFLLDMQAISENQLQFVVRIEGPNAERFNRVVLTYASSADERFFGFGQQLTYFNQKGRVIPILVQEHGVGRGLPAVTQLSDLEDDGAGGTPYVTEAPAPHYITSQLRSVFLENKEYSAFDLRADNRVEVTLLSGVMTGRILFGRTPLDLIEEYTAYAGRMRPLPAWVHEGVMVAVQGGTARANTLLTALLAAHVPLSSLWIQDWSGTKITTAGHQVRWNYGNSAPTNILVG